MSDGASKVDQIADVQRFVLVLSTPNICPVLVRWSRRWRRSPRQSLGALQVDRCTSKMNVWGSALRNDHESFFPVLKLITVVSQKPLTWPFFCWAFSLRVALMCNARSRNYQMTRLYLFIACQPRKGVVAWPRDAAIPQLDIDIAWDGDAVYVQFLFANSENWYSVIIIIKMKLE